MTQEKDYYRTLELHQKYNVTFDEVRYKVEQDNLPLSVFLNNTKVVLGVYEETFIGIAHCKISGIVSLTHEDSMKLITNGSVSFNTARVRKMTVSCYSTEYPFVAKLPNSVLGKWKEVPFSKIPNNLWLKLYPSETLPAKLMLSGIQAMLENLGNEEKTKEISKNTINAFQSDEFKDLTHTSKKIASEDICIFKKELQRLLDGKKQAKSLGNNESVKSEMKALTLNLCELFPTKSARELWEILRTSHESDDRLDPNSIVDEVGSDTIWWTDSQGKEKTWAWKTFKNEVSKFKK